MHDETLIGVIELASLKQFEAHQIEIGENIASILATTIIATRNNAQTSELLTKSQQQAAEMAEQEEEMRQNMEELKATQEESLRREEDLESVLNTLNRSFYIIEYDTKGIVCKANEKILSLLNLTTDKVLGKSHAELFGKGSKADSLLFDKVSEGNIVELNEKLKINNRPLELNYTFSPIQSKAGKILRILNIMSVNY
jgi:transcriptional regulator with PAS, ATPase and Fis domain